MTVHDKSPGNAGASRIGDLVFAAAIVVVAAVVWIGTADLPPPRYEPLGSAAIPRGVALIMAVLALFVGVRALRREPTGAGEDRLDARVLARVIMLSALTLLYVSLMDARVLGFRTASIFFVILAGLILAGVTLRSVLVSSIFAFVLTFAIHTAFTRFFYIDLP